LILVSRIYLCFATANEAFATANLKAIASRVLLVNALIGSLMYKVLIISFCSTVMIIDS
jgi:hypothetical protein